MSGDPMLKVTDLHVSYGRVEALHGVSLSVRPGQIATVIGANGAGKSTLLAAVMGLLPSSGTIEFPGLGPVRPTVEARVRSGLCLVPETRDLFGSMSVEDNLRLGAFTRRGDRGAVAEDMERTYGLFPRLRERRRQTADTLSGGERQMLALGRALMARPRLLLLDEPSLGLSPVLAKEMIRMVAALRDSGIAILLVEQNARAALRIANYAYVLETGSLVLEGPAGQIARDPQVIASYVGGTADSRAAATSG